MANWMTANIANRFGDALSDGFAIASSLGSMNRQTKNTSLVMQASYSFHQQNFGLVSPQLLSDKFNCN